MMKYAVITQYGPYSGPYNYEKGLCWINSVENGLTTGLVRGRLDNESQAVLHLTRQGVSRDDIEIIRG